MGKRTTEPGYCIRCQTTHDGEADGAWKWPSRCTNPCFWCMKSSQPYHHVGQACRHLPSGDKSAWTKCDRTWALEVQKRANLARQQAEFEASTAVSQPDELPQAHQIDSHAGFGAATGSETAQSAHAEDEPQVFDHDDDDYDDMDMEEEGGVELDDAGYSLEDHYEFALADIGRLRAELSRMEGENQQLILKNKLLVKKNEDLIAERPKMQESFAKFGYVKGRKEAEEAYKLARGSS